MERLQQGTRIRNWNRKANVLMRQSANYTNLLNNFKSIRLILIIMLMQEPTINSSPWSITILRVWYVHVALC